MEMVGIAPDGETALARIEQSTPCVTLDAELSGISGLQTLREICKHWRRSPVIMLSTLTEKGAANEKAPRTSGALFI